MKRNPNKLFIIKKYVMAKSAREALRKERRMQADDVWVDEEWKKNNAENLAKAIGFKATKKDG